MTTNQFKAALLIGTFLVAVALDYVLAVLGEPRALWMWRDVLGVIPAK